TTSYFMAPGRLNMFELDGYRVVVDYAHHPPAVRALGDFVDRLTQPSAGGARPPVTGRRIGVIATAGDRRDDDIVELGQVAAAYFDEIIVREDANNRGRPRGQTAELIVQGIGQANADASRVGPIVTILDELEATRHALDIARDGDVVVVCVDHANQIWKELQRRQHGAASDADGLRAVVGVLGADDEIEIDT
ncbi:MAG: glutamate ligase domain-containing protein, partial [Candidatus Limnocylindria bacterium]